MRKKFREHKKFLVKMVLLFWVFALIMTVVSLVFVLKDSHYYAINTDVTDTPYYAEKWNGFYEKEIDTIDVLFLGTSVVHTDVDVNLMYENYGFTSYVLSADMQTGTSVFYVLKEALKYQSPEVVFIEVQALAKNVSTTEVAEHYTYDFMRNGLNKIQGICSLDDIELEELLFPFTKYHARWEELEKQDFEYVLSDKENVLNGHFIYMLNNAQREPVVYERWEYTLEDLGYEDTKNNLDTIVEYCDDNGIQCVFFKTPIVYTYEQSKIWDAIENYANSKGVTFWDFNKDSQEIGIDYTTDYVDAGHMNQTGSEKFSLFLGDKIKANYILDDHRGQFGYEEWDQAWDYQNYLIHAFDIRHYATAQDYADNGDFDNENLVYIFTYDNMNDLQKCSGIPSCVKELRMENTATKVCILSEGKILQEICLKQGEQWKENISLPDALAVESLSTGTKIWFEDEYLITEQQSGVVDLIIYDKKLEKVLDHVSINVNANSHINHILNPY